MLTISGTTMFAYTERENESSLCLLSWLGRAFDVEWALFVNTTSYVAKSPPLKLPVVLDLDPVARAGAAPDPFVTTVSSSLRTARSSGRTLKLFNKVQNDQFPTITTVPAGMPGNPAVDAQPNPPQMFAG